MSYWTSKSKHTYVALLDGKIVGTYWLTDNQPNQGNHIANAAYIVDTKFSGNGIGKAMCEHSNQVAIKLGYQAIQFNFVLKHNTNAVELWKKMGFKIIGEIPEAYRSVKFGFINAYIMYKKLI